MIERPDYSYGGMEVSGALRRPGAQGAVVALVGAPGSGKGSVGKWLQAQSASVFHLSTGDAMRQNRERGVFMPIDRRIGMATVAATVRLVNQCHADSGRPVMLLDGFPREITQVHGLAMLSAPLAGVIHLDVPYALSIERMKHRGREGEDIQVIARRLEAHYQREPEVLSALASGGVAVVRIDATRSVDEVCADALRALSVITAGTIG